MTSHKNQQYARTDKLISLVYFKNMQKEFANVNFYAAFTSVSGSITTPSGIECSVHRRIIPQHLDFPNGSVLPIYIPSTSDPQFSVFTVTP